MLATKGYQIVIIVVKGLREETLQEDKGLLVLYDMAQTRTEEK